MWAAGIRYRKQYGKVPGRPDFVIVYAKIAIFCDSSFWHGRNWPESAAAFRTNRDFWLPKIEGNIRRDGEVNEQLARLGWTVLRFWDDDILKRTDACVAAVLHARENAFSLKNYDKNCSS
jgi:DNA mismatch endonuclease Vsr